MYLSVQALALLFKLARLQFCRSCNDKQIYHQTVSDDDIITRWWHLLWTCSIFDTNLPMNHSMCQVLTPILLICVFFPTKHGFYWVLIRLNNVNWTLSLINSNIEQRKTQFTFLTYYHYQPQVNNLTMYLVLNDNLALPQQTNDKQFVFKFSQQQQRRRTELILCINTTTHEPF